MSGTARSRREFGRAAFDLWQRCASAPHARRSSSIARAVRQNGVFSAALRSAVLTPATARHSAISGEERLSTTA